MKEIKLTQGQVAFVDDEDFEYLNQFKWTATKRTHTYYARRSITVDGVKVNVIMHRVIMNTPSELQVDHIDHNGLNNQKYNLRNCTNSQNKMNRRIAGELKYMGVTKIITPKNKLIRFVAQIQHDNIIYRLGTFDTAIDAARSYNNAAIKYHGEFANLNIFNENMTKVIDY